MADHHLLPVFVPAFDPLPASARDVKNRYVASGSTRHIPIGGSVGNERATLDDNFPDGLLARWANIHLRSSANLKRSEPPRGFRLHLAGFFRLPDFVRSRKIFGGRKSAST